MKYKVEVECGVEVDPFIDNSPMNVKNFSEFLLSMIRIVTKATEEDVVEWISDTSIFQSTDQSTATSQVPVLHITHSRTR